MGTLSLDPAVALVLRVGAALLLLSAALHKLRDLPGFERALAGYALLPAASVTACARVFTGLEIALGLGCLAPATTRLSLLVGSALLSLYTGAVGANLVRGRSRLDCGCGGPGGPRTLSVGLVVRNLALIALLLLAALPSSARTFCWIDAVTVGAGVGCLALVYAAVDLALALGVRARGEGGLSWSRH